MIRPSRYDREDVHGSTKIIADVMAVLLSLVLAGWLIGKPAVLLGLVLAGWFLGKFVKGCWREKRK